jgi:hypothetical protein
LAILVFNLCDANQREKYPIPALLLSLPPTSLSSPLW